MDNFWIINVNSCSIKSREIPSSHSCHSCHSCSQIFNRYPSYLIPHTSHLTHHTSHIIPHTSPIRIIRVHKSLTTSSLKQVPLLRTQQSPVFKCLEGSITLPSSHLVVLYHIVAVSDKHRHPVLVKIFVFPSAAFHSFQKIIVVSPSQAVSICKPPPFGSFFHSQSCSSYDAAPEVSCGTESLSLPQETNNSAINGKSFFADIIIIDNYQIFILFFA